VSVTSGGLKRFGGTWSVASGEMCGYLNGIAGAFGATYVAPSSMPATAMIGRLTSTAQPFEGPMKRVIVYGRALTPAEYAYVNSVI
jgi:hypothetical protein